MSVATDTSFTHFTRTAERAANQVISAYSTSFGLACRLLGSRHRQHVRNIYALVRVADELVDGVTAEAGLSYQEQCEALTHFIDETHRAVQLGYSSDLIIHAFAQTARAARIDQSLIDPFFDSMRMDLGEQTEAAPQSAPLRRFDADAHDGYVHGSAEVVGLMCLRVFMRDEKIDDGDAAALEYGASRLGAAFQNINFLRDLADDTTRLGRSYLGTSDHLEDQDRMEWVRTIRAQLADANAVIPLLPRDARAAVRSASALFQALTDRIEQTTVDELYRSRVRVPDAVKAGLAARAVASTWMELHK
ncbi:squalene/phytoene synthase family protein [Paenarthrobacter aurescens]|uniref:Phytoene synthase n=1 Tax=Paenarthrobacter aurescens TaxID=43663 RepID=A0A4Y3NGP4_PAEAU|nr:squalene/phytoene synthase family protein [Paenarthrobacter aurescens]MDO6142034.1 squalene/phytoene synthase family protein [Paenarthrobacter aurescens]MDO6145838.1 squalene/phytoene synthase family protein [Paenarthrobacter aurescens]MDO6157083.1 squalene/phytoene synthase family protein [Paenarthrobacter aurescens]MDO6161069.1 squalene/phytoene synthase family protein [Paenarthrobacter aurescens]GEB21000.1 phytoene synthase [Paenarthrobacter aurescens]